MGGSDPKRLLSLWSIASLSLTNVLGDKVILNCVINKHCGYGANFPRQSRRSLMYIAKETQRTQYAALRLTPQETVRAFDSLPLTLDKFAGQHRKYDILRKMMS